MSDLLDGLALALSLGAFGFSFLAWKRADLGYLVFREMGRLVGNLNDYLVAATNRIRSEAGPAESANEGEIPGVAWAGTGFGPVTRPPR